MLFMLLNLCTVFFIVAGAGLLWLNLRSLPRHKNIPASAALQNEVGKRAILQDNLPAFLRPSCVSFQEISRSGSVVCDEHPLISVLQAHLRDIGAAPQVLGEGDALADRVAAAMSKGRRMNPP